MPKIENIYCIGRNYRKHAEELGNTVPTEPIVFLKTNSSIRSLEKGIIGFTDQSYNYEAEIVIKISDDISIGSKPGWNAVSSLALGIDLTRRKAQDKLKSAGHPWTIAKSFAGSALLGDFRPKSDFQDLDSIKFSFALNEEVKQYGDSSKMIFSIPKIIDYLLTFTDLKNGDIIFTGTPEGVGEISRGDSFYLKWDFYDKKMRGTL
jgi:2-keto-4-pentenoate hydratase/2-oxohepta-3-ene-1,7-dioic acid hydratase in catechol pathway